MGTSRGETGGGDTGDGFTEIKEAISKSNDSLNEDDDWIFTPSTSIPPEGVYFNTLSEITTAPLANGHLSTSDKPLISAHESFNVQDEKGIKYKLKIYDQHRGQRALAQLEAVAASFYQLLSASYQQIPPSTSVCYNNKKEAVGVLSELFKEWIPYKKESLKHDDLTIQLIHIEEEKDLQEKLKKQIENYTMTDLNRSYTNGPENQKLSAYSFGRLYGAATTFAFNAATLAKNTANYYIASAASANQLAQRLKIYFTQENQFSLRELAILSKELEDRKNHIQPFIKDANRHESDQQKYQTEINSLTTILQTINQLKNLVAAKPLETFTATEIEQLETLDEAANKTSIDLDKKNDNERLNNLLPSSDISITVKSLKNYRLIKGLATVLVTRYLLEDDDTHANNISKKGKQLDFDRSFIHFLTQFPELYALKQNLIQKTLGIREPTKDTFAITGDVVKIFPIPPKDKTSHPFYSPAYPVGNQPVAIQNAIAMSEAASKNFYTPHDHAIFEELSKHPVFQFHVQKTFLKYLLISTSFYEPFFDLHMDNEGEIKEVRDKLSAHESARIQESRKALLKDPDFRRFITEQGEVAAGLIKAEILEFKTMLLERYQKELKNVEDTATTCKEKFSELTEAHKAVCNMSPIDTSKCQIALEKLQAAEKDDKIATQALERKTKQKPIFDNINKTINSAIIQTDFNEIKQAIRSASPSTGWMNMIPAPREIMAIEAKMFSSNSPPASPKEERKKPGSPNLSTIWTKPPTTGEIKKIEEALFLSAQNGC